MFPYILLLLVCAPLNDGDIALLGDDSYDVREAAQAKIEKGMDFNFYQKLKAYYTDDFEIYKRIHQILRNYELRFVSRYSLNLRNLKTYPAIDELPKNYQPGGSWIKFTREDIIDTYVACATAEKIPDRNPGEYLVYRRATDIFLRERIFAEFRDAAERVHSEKKLDETMAVKLKPIQADLDMMIENANKNNDVFMHILNTLEF